MCATGALIRAGVRSITNEIERCRSARRQAGDGDADRVVVARVGRETEGHVGLHGRTAHGLTHDHRGAKAHDRYGGETRGLKFLKCTERNSHVVDLLFSWCRNITTKVAIM